MESLYPKLNLCGIRKECTRTDTVFFPISEVSKGTVSLFILLRLSPKMFPKESIYPELALCGSKKECARTDTVFCPISEVSEGTVSLKVCELV